MSKSCLRWVAYGRGATHGKQRPSAREILALANLCLQILQKGGRRKGLALGEAGTWKARGGVLKACASTRACTNLGFEKDWWVRATAKSKSKGEYGKALNRLLLIRVPLPQGVGRFLGSKPLKRELEQGKT